jgi:subtilisin family serine protease
MKKLTFFLLLFLLCTVHQANADIYIIGNDTIHFENDKYFVIGIADTFYIDTTLLFVKYNSLATAFDRSTIETNYNLSKDYDFSFGWTTYTYSQSNQSFIELASDLNDEPLIDMVDFNTNVYFNCDELVPSDSYYPDQWYLERISAPFAWAITTGNPDIIVAIIDTGFDWEHPDLGPGNDGYDNIFLNEEEDDWEYWNDPASGNGWDDDNNGCIDDWKGWGEIKVGGAFPLGNDVRPYDLDWLKIYFQNPIYAYNHWMHGTFIAGIIGAKTNNDIGISGIAGGWQSKGSSMLLFKSGISDHHGSWAERVAIGIDYAVNKLPNEQSARIIEMAFSAYDWADYIKETIETAYVENNVFFVAAAGNFTTGSSAVTFPANHPYVFAVGATTQEDLRKSNSCYGTELDLGAPGKDIYGLVPQYEYEPIYKNIEGNTSAASAMVAGTAALMLSVNPDLSNAELAQMLRGSADKVREDHYTYVNGRHDEIGYGRLNTYKAVCSAWNSNEDLKELESDDTWDEDKSLSYSVYIKDGVTLTINSTIQFGPNARLIVEQGGTLILDGGTLTNFKCCDWENTPWPGIEVWGDNTASQHPLPGNPCAQGKLILKNGATIENAVVAVELWKPGDYSTTGGIIDATDSYFRNNVISVHALWYRNFNPADPNSEMDYYGTFTNCSFIIDDDYLGDKTFYKHVDLARVRGLKFYGCDFSLHHQAPNVSQWNHAIAAYNAGFHVLPVCTSSIHPCPEYDSCRFKGFDRAIGAFGSPSIDPPILINSAHFNDNSTGIFLSGTDYAVVINNFIKVGYDDPYIGNCGFANGVGIDIHTSNGFAVENNRLIKNSQAAAGTYAGIRVASCPSVHDIIYKNELTGLSYGNFAQGTNRSLAIDDGTGVEYQCNYNSHNAIDFIVTDTNYYNAMIRGWHGSRETASGNVFSQLYSAEDWHFRNEGRQEIKWYFCEPCNNEEPLKVFADPPELFEKIESDEFNCPDHYGGGGQIRMTESERIDREVAFVQNLNDFNSVKYLYESLVDGGNTESVLSDIQAAEPGDMWALRSQLLGSSPHLSQEVLRAIADRTDVFPDGILLEILSANPDELKRDTLLSYLEQKDNPLPQYMIEILRQALEGVTYKTILLDEMARYHAGKTQAAQDLIRDVLFDTAFNPVEYRNRLGNMNNLVADRQIIGSYLSEKDTSGAMTLLNLLPLLYDLEGESLEDYNNYKTLVEMQVSWIAQGKMTHEPDSMEIPVLLAIAENGSSYAGNLARNILEYANVQHYCRCLPLIDTAYVKHAPAPAPEPHMESQGLIISAKPNPGRTYVAFDYELPDEEATGNISISDVTGRAIHQIPVKGKAGQKVWNTSGVTAGMYYYTLKSSGMVKSGKILIY